VSPSDYTASDSKIWRWQEGALNLSQAKPTPKQLNLKGWAMQAGLKFSGCPTKPEQIFESRAVLFCFIENFSEVRSETHAKKAA
jgi:hypothetical protein